MKQTSLKSKFIFNQEDWKMSVVNTNTMFSLIIPVKEHDRGDSPIVQVYIKVNEQDDFTQYNQSELLVNLKGDITFRVPSNPFFLTKILVL